jgi:hypothetical protein
MVGQWCGDVIEPTGMLWARMPVDARTSAAMLVDETTAPVGSEFLHATFSPGMIRDNKIVSRGRINC